MKMRSLFSGMTVLAVFFCMAGILMGQTEELSLSPPKRLAPLQLHQLDSSPSVGFLNDVEGARLYSGRKTLFVKPDAQPASGQQNWRKALAKFTGITLEEEESQQVRLNPAFRGLPPVNAQFTQLLVDGFPVNADMYGALTGYYQPDLNGVSEIQVISSGAGVLFGSQHGCAIQFVTYKPPSDQPFHFKSVDSVGSHGFFSSYNEASGFVDGVGYVAFGKIAEGGGYRNRQAFEINYGGFKLFLGYGTPTRWTLGFTAYTDRTEEPGGLTSAQYNANPRQATVSGDFLKIQRYAPTLLMEHELSETSKIEWRTWLTYLSSFFDRTASRDHQEQRVSTGGTEARFLHTYDLFSSTDNAFTGGILFQYTDLPILNIRTTTGITRANLSRYNGSASAFAENKFQITERWSVTPGGRLENVWEGADGPIVGGVAGQVNREIHNFEPIWSLGTEFDLIESETIHARPLTLYGNVSTGYRPATFAEGVQNPSSFSINSDLSASHNRTGEVGLRSSPVPWHLEDFSVFHMTVDDQIGTVNGLVQNIGATEHEGLEWFQQTDLFCLMDWIERGEVDRPAPFLRNGKVELERKGWGRGGALNLYSALSFLQAEITASPVAGDPGRSPQNAPPFNARFGLEYNYFERVKSSLQATYVSESYGSVVASDFAAATEQIPGYTVWDWSTEAFIAQDYVSVFFGINNLFDSRYYSRSRGGIDPSLERNYYGGIKITY